MDRRKILELKKYLVHRGVTVNGYNKSSSAEITNSVRKMDIPCIHTMHDKVCGEKGNELFIDDMQIGDPFKMTDLVNNFMDSPPFGLYDNFSFLICHSTAYDKQGPAAYHSTTTVCLRGGGYIESLLPKTLTKERLHV